MSSDPREVVRERLLNWGFKPGEGLDHRGRPLAWSLDCRELTLHGPTLDTIAQLLWPRVALYQPGLIAGPSLSADPIVAALLLAAHREGAEVSGGLLRREPKGYGLGKLVEGPPVMAGVTAVVVDDVLTRGSSAARTVRVLRELGAVPRAVVTIVDLERQDQQRLEGIQYETLFTASELGLALFTEPPVLTTRGWIVRGINSPIPAAHPEQPIVAGEEVILAGDRRGVLVVNQRGREQTVDASATMCDSTQNGILVLGSATAVRAIDRVSLRPLWSMDLAARAVCGFTTGEVIVARLDVPEVLSIDARSGTVRASLRLAAKADAVQVIGGTLIVVTESGLVALDKSLDMRWYRAEPVRSLAGSDCGLYVLTHEPALARLNLQDGAVDWSRHIGQRALPQLLAAENRVAFAVESVVVGLSAAGATRWVHSAPRRIVVGPVACGPDALAIADRGGIVRVLGIASGEHISSYSALPVRPIALAGSQHMLAAIGLDGDARGIDLANSGVA